MASEIPQYSEEIRQMMYVAGETRDPSASTLIFVEKIMHDQVVSMLTTANDLSRRRGSPVFSNDDLIFQFRHSDATVARIRNFLSWKAVRKSAKDSDDKDNTTGDLFEADISEAQERDDGIKDGKVPIAPLPWDVGSYYSITLPPSEAHDEDEVEQSMVLERLRQIAERTRNMSVEEYQTWSEYRRASLVGRRAKKFREWSGLGRIADHKTTDDVLDILGLLTCEMVQKLTIVALGLQEQETLSLKDKNISNNKVGQGLASGIFASSESSGTDAPLEPRHIRQAFESIERESRRGPRWNGTNKTVNFSRIIAL
ncbi:TFIID-18kDa-domain-containing protein [Thozetella sp. PMI_491]|nr:TFIID-18kDa-domain-containing protein [Thozetella sp. PMI_491]